MSTKTFQTVCPVFPGFYESSLSIDSDRETDFIERFCEYEDFPEAVLLEYFGHHDLDLKIAEYEAEVGRIFGDYVAEELSEIIGSRVLSAFVRISSPKYYNFETDKVILNIELDPRAVVKECREHYEDFVRFLDDNMSPRDGFIPFYGTNPEWWLDSANWDELPVLGFILDFLIRQHVQDPEYHFSERTLEDIELDDYMDFPKEVREYLESDDARDYRPEYERLMQQGWNYLDAMKRDHPEDWEKYVPEVEKGKARVIRELAEDLDKSIRKFARETA